MNKTVLIVLAIGLMLTGLVVGTGVVLRSTSGMDTDDPELFISLGNFLFNKGMTGYAIDVYGHALQMDPENYKVLNNLGVSYLDIDLEMAYDFFTRSLEYEPSYEIARKNLGVLCNKLSLYGEAAYHFGILVDTLPNDVRYRYDLAVNLGNKYYHESRDFSDLINALQHYYKVQEVSPGYEMTLENIKVLEEIKGLYNSS